MLSQTRNALGNLVNRYRAVLRKCRLCNAFGSLAVAAMLVMGGAGGAAAEIPTGEWWESADKISLESGEEWELNGETYTNVQTAEISIESGASMTLKNESSLSGDSLNFYNYGTLTLNNSSLEVQSMSGAGTLIMSGTATLSADKLYSGGDIKVGTLNVSGEVSLTALGDIRVTDLMLTDGMVRLTGDAIDVDTLSVAREAILTAEIDSPVADITVGALNVFGEVTLTAIGNAPGHIGSNIEVGALNVSGEVTLTASRYSHVTDLTMTDGILLARSGDITLQNKATGISGRIEAATGSISAADIIGASGGSLDLVAGKDITAGAIAANNVTADNITASGLSADQLTAGGDVALTGGSLRLAAGNIDGALRLDGVRGAGGHTTMGDGLILSGGSEVAFDSLTPGGDVLVGTDTDTTGSTLTVKETLDLGGHVLAVDPAWGGKVSNVAVNSINDDPTAEDILINGGVAVGQNAYAAIGTPDTTWLPEVAGPLSQGGITAALGVFRPLTIAAGDKLLVDGSRMGNALYNGTNGAYDTAAANSVTLAANSLLVVNGAATGTGTAAISFAAGTGTLQVANGAKLLIADAVAGEEYTIVADAGNLATAFNNTNYDDAAATGWKGENLLAGGATMKLVGRYDAAANTLVFTAAAQAAADVYPGLSAGMAEAVGTLYATHTDPDGTQWNHADVDSPHMGVRFLSRATDNRYIGGNAPAAARTIESAARMALAGAVPQMTRMAADAGVNAVVNRLGLAHPASGMQTVNSAGQPAGDDDLGLALWIAPTWQNRTGFNMDADHLDGGFSGNIGGVAIGADYTFENALRAGITVNMGGGFARSGGDYAETTNNMSYWGLGLYAGWSHDDFALMADAGYTATYNKLKQDLDAGMGMRDLKADVRASAWQAGLRAEYTFATPALDITPHVGARYLNLRTWGYDVTSNGAVLAADDMTQNIWTFPVGVTFSKDVALDDGWRFRPSVDFTIIPAVGDIDARQEVRFTGLPGAYEVETQTMDYLTWQGGVGLELGDDTLSVGLNYTLQAGQTGTGHGIFASFRYEF